MSLIIYTPSDGAVFRDVLNSIALLVSNRTFSSALDIVTTLSVLAVVFAYIKSANIPVLLQWVINSFCILFILVGIKTQVNIVDMSDPMAAYTVSDVPIGIGLPAFVVSSIGQALTNATSAVGHMPQDMDYNKRGMLFGSRIWTGATGFNLKDNPDLSRDVTSYISQCIFKSKILVSKKLLANDLKNDTKLIDTLFKNPSPVYGVVMHDGTNLTCQGAAEVIKPLVSKAYEKGLANIARIMLKGSVADAEQEIVTAHNYFGGLSDTGANILTQNVLINALREAEQNVFSFNGDIGQIMNYANTTTQQKMRHTEANDFWQSEYQLPLIMSSLWMVTICMFPLVILISFFPQCQNVYSYYVSSLIYLWSWPILFNLIHLIVSSAASTKISLLTGGVEGGITLANIDTIKAIHSDFALKAGRLTALVPILSFGIVKGLPYVLNQAAQTFFSVGQSLSSGEAQAVTQGNISMGNYSGWNMNYDSVNAHKHDTNATHMKGQTSIQYASGGIDHISGEGQHAFSMGTSMSNSSVSITGTESMQKSLSHAKDSTLQEMDGFNTSLSTSLTNASNHASQYSHTQGQDERLGEGVSTTESANAQIAMSNLIHRASDIAEKTGVGFDEAFSGLTRAGMGTSAGIDSKKGLGSLLHWTTGAHGEVNVSTGGEQSQNTTDRYSSGTDYTISAREAEDIRKDISTVESYAKNHHFDSNHSQSENMLIQTGNDLRDAQVASDGFNASLQKSERITDAENRLTSNSANETINLNQQAVDYGIQKVGLEHMRYLELHPQDATAQKELSSIKNEFMQHKTQEILNHGIDGLSVNPNGAYNQVKNSVQTNRENLTQDFSSKTQELWDLSKSQGLGVNANDKKELMSNVDSNLSSYQSQNSKKSAEMHGKFKHSEAAGQKEIYDERGKARAVPVFNKRMMSKFHSDKGDKR